MSSSFFGFLRRSASRLHGRDRLGDVLLVAQRGRQDVAIRHERHELGLDVDDLVVGLDVDLVARVHFALVHDLVLLERLADVRLQQLGQRVDGVRQVQQAALRRFLASTPPSSRCR